MRLRYVKGAKELILAHPEWIRNDDTHEPLPLSTWFPQDQPLHVEIGMGKGQFLYQLATLHPTINYLGIEKFDSAIVKALYKQIEIPRDNLRFLRGDAIHLEDLFPPHSISRIYLNFSDPWPKVRHEKRRLTNPLFLTRYQHLLVPGGDIHMKTDNAELFAYSMETIEAFGMKILSHTSDLHATAQDIVTTEFEDRFVGLGQPIYQLIATFKEEDHG